MFHGRDVADVGLLSQYLSSPQADPDHVPWVLEKNGKNYANGKLKNTMLHVAVEDRLSESVELLVQSGADVNVKNRNDQTPLDLALDSGGCPERIINLLKEASGRETKLEKRFLTFAVNIEQNITWLKELYEIFQDEPEEFPHPQVLAMEVLGYSWLRRQQIVRPAVPPPRMIRKAIKYLFYAMDDPTFDFLFRDDDHDDDDDVDEDDEAINDVSPLMTILKRLPTFRHHDIPIDRLSGDDSEYWMRDVAPSLVFGHLLNEDESGWLFVEVDYYQGEEEKFYEPMPREEEEQNYFPGSADHIPFTDQDQDHEEHFQDDWEVHNELPPPLRAEDNAAVLNPPPTFKVPSQEMLLSFFDLYQPRHKVRIMQEISESDNKDNRMNELCQTISELFETEWSEYMQGISTFYSEARSDMSEMEHFIREGDEDREQNSSLVERCQLTISKLHDVGAREGNLDDFSLLMARYQYLLSMLIDLQLI